MKRAGLVGIKFGVETGDAEMMKRIRKHLDLDRVRQSVAWCKELGIGVHLTFSFGGPGETRETAEKTIRLALDLDPESLQFSLMTPFPGTVMFRDAIANGTLLTTDWKQFDGARYTVVQGEHLTREELEGLLDEAHRRWTLHLAEREALRALGWPGRPEASASVAWGEVAALADGSLDLLVVTTPLEVVGQCNRREELLAVFGRQVSGVIADAVCSFLNDCYTKLRPGGVLVAYRGAEAALPDGWSDEWLTLDWVTSNGAEPLCSLQGFNGELVLAARRTREHDAYDEVAEFTGLSRSEVQRRCLLGNWWTADRWYAANPTNAAEREAFYRTSDAYLFELTHWEVVDATERRALAGKLSGRMLEFGAGVGTLAIFSAEAGCDVDTYDIGERTSAFLRWRLKRRHADVADRVHVLGGTEELGVYDTITCLHVLEHVEDPHALMRMLYEHLMPGGKLWLVAPFREELTEKHPLHLAAHAQLTLDGLLAEVGADLVGWDQLSGYDLCVGRRPVEAPAATRLPETLSLARP
ncbi:MAG: methyltransferase domain-containing protein [Armatimonadetes bacterium]|nr:methyltransferase domain-containing protein [Armatimonadota bacterium]